MAFPNYPGKHDEEALVTPAKNSEYKQEMGKVDDADRPDGVVLCYSRTLMEYLTDTRDGRQVGNYYGDLYVFDETDKTVGVLGNFGIGAPTTALLMDELVADGVEAFLSIGFAGCLDPSIEMGEFIVPETAIRDEGTSHHYLPPETEVTPSESLVAETKRVLNERDESFHFGPTWTTDAIYRETKAEVDHYAEEGVLTVEMEASAVFAVAEHRGVDAGAMFVVSDYLGTAEWEPKFHLTETDMQRLGATAKKIVASYVD